MSGYTVIPAADVKKIPDANAVIVDVRTPLEHQTQRLLRPHEHMPLDLLNPKDFMLRRGLDRETPVYLLCRGGTRARAAAEKFIAAGYPNVHVIEGGIVACEGCGVEVSSAQAGAATGTKIISLERQVRIAAGALVVVGSILGYFLSPAFYLLSLLVGAGLVYAGITDRCGMALVLTKAPWNKAAAAGACSIIAAPGPKSPGGCA
ncbi:MAG: rhodanese-like domain-containing protein [Alphaproteobacteria bacterium]|nr:rhodanese-like domain-containing protein [Alphaproteobacteria bacterium]